MIRPEENIYQIPWIPWFPVDSEPLAPAIRVQVEKAELRIVFSKFAIETVNKAGLDCVYVPHGVDTKAFKPMTKDERGEARKWLGWPEDAFVVGMVAANKGTPSRKSFCAALEAFAKFRKKHTDAFLYLHTNKSENGENNGVNLPELCAWLELGPDAVRFCDQYTYLLGFPTSYMAKAYGAMDVHMLPSMGEGFGIPIVEAQACGTPVIVGDWTAMSELCFSGWKIPKEDAEPWWTPLATYQYRPHIGGIVNALERSYEGRGKEHLRKKARVGALDYDADLIAERYWKPVLEAVEESLKERTKLELVKF